MIAKWSGIAKQLEVHHLEGSWHLPDKRWQKVEMFWTRLKRDETSWKPFVDSCCEVLQYFNPIQTENLTGRLAEVRKSDRKPRESDAHHGKFVRSILERPVLLDLLDLGGISKTDGVSDGETRNAWAMTMKNTSWHIVTHGFVFHSHVIWIWSESRIRCSANKASQFSSTFPGVQQSSTNIRARQLQVCVNCFRRVYAGKGSLEPFWWGPASSCFLLFTLLLIHVSHTHTYTSIYLSIYLSIYHMEMCGTLLRSAQSGNPSLRGVSLNCGIQNTAEAFGVMTTQLWMIDREMGN